MATSMTLLIIMCFISLSHGASDTQSAPTLAAPGEFPHMVLIGWNNNNDTNISYTCAGSLIKTKFVLTTGRCTSKPEIPKVVLLGTLDIDYKGSEAQVIPVKKVHTHPDYEERKYYNDISIIELERTVRINKNVKPACLFKKPEVDIKSLIGSGWKFPSQEDETSPLHKDSRKLNKYKLSDDKCDLSLIKDGGKMPNGLADYQICLKSPSMVSGSMIQSPQKNTLCRHNLYAFTAFGQDNNEVYIKTSHFYDWIKSITSQK